MLSLSKQLEELVLIRCSLLPGEQLEFLDLTQEAKEWQELVDGLNPTEHDAVVGDMEVLSAPRFRLKVVDNAIVWFDIDFQGYNGDCETVRESVRASGENMSRMTQEKWRERIKDKVGEVAEMGSVEFPIYQLLTLHLLPMLHEEIKDNEDAGTSSIQSNPQATGSVNAPLFHVLFTSHHLISPTKRRNLQQWSSSLNISGFAKVGYPGVIYAQGSEDSIEEFIRNVKAMQWLALKLRFVEPLKLHDGEVREEQELRAWREFERVGEVVDEMKRLGRGSYVLEMGIGSGGRAD